MGEHTQYPALNDLEKVVRELSAVNQRPVAVVFDPLRGWCVSDEVQVASSRHGESEPKYTVMTYGDWFRQSVSEAAQVVCGARFLPQSLVGRLMRRAPAFGKHAGGTAPGTAAPEKSGGKVT